MSKLLPAFMPGMREMSETTTVIIPAFNEAKAIGDVVASIRETMGDYRILVVDDGSTDGTGDKAREAGADVVAHEMNKGYGAALATGIRAADTDIVVFMDADGQHDPEDVRRAVDEIAGYDMVVGARTSDSHRDARRAPGKFVLRVFANYLARHRIPDVNSGLRAFRREVILRYLHLMPDGFSFSTTSTFAMLKGKRRIRWIPIVARRRVGTSTVRQLKHGPQTMMLMLRLTVLFDPLRVFLPISGLLIALAVLWSAINFIYYRPAIPATSVFLSLTGVSVFLMGLVTDQVSAIRREIHDR